MWHQSGRAGDPPDAADSRDAGKRRKSTASMTRLIFGNSKHEWHQVTLAVGRPRHIGAVCLAFISIERGEPANALWIVVGAICTYLVSYRYYSLFIANKVMRLDPNRATPAARLNNGLDYVPLLLRQRVADGRDAELRNLRGARPAPRIRMSLS